MITEEKLQIDGELLAELRAKAAAEGKTFDQGADDALRQYLEKDQWERLVASKREAARAMGLTEADVPRLVVEARRERRGL